jgi:hypothetical protein
VGFAPRVADRLRHSVDADSVQSERGGHERVLTGSAPNIQDASSQHTALNQFHEGGLGPPNVPRRRAGVIHRIEAVKPLRP